MTDERKKAPIEGPNGVDRWTSNGYGLTIDGKPVEPPKQDGESDNPAENPDVVEE